jgi:hypothetical protein
MRYMNDYDLLRAARVHADQPNRMQLIHAVDSLRQWADRNSDGWAYWPKPARSAARAMELIMGDGTNAADRRPDATDAEVKAALSPIKAFLTRQGVDHSTVL